MLILGLHVGVALGTLYLSHRQYLSDACPYLPKKVTLLLDKWESKFSVH